MFAEDLEIARLTWGPGKIASFAGIATLFIKLKQLATSSRPGPGGTVCLQCDYGQSAVCESAYF